MKKTVLFSVFLVVAVAMTSCLRSDDLEILRHPIHVTGTVEPQYGIPVVSGELNINDLLSSLSATYQGMITSDPVVTVEYDTAYSDTIRGAIEYTNMGKGVIKGSKGDIWYSKDTTIVDTIDIDFFNDVDYRGQIDIEHIWLNLGVRAYGICSEIVRPHVRARFENLTISYDDHDGNRKSFTNFSVGRIDIDDITDGLQRQFDSIDISDIVNDMPRRIFTTYRMKFRVNEALLDENMANMTYSELLDTIRMTRFIYAADLKVTMPLSVQFNDLNFTYNLDLGSGLSSVNLDSILASISQGVNVDIEKMRFRLSLDNGIPLDMVLNASMLNANGDSIIGLFKDVPIASANVGPSSDNPAILVAIGDRNTSAETVLNNNDIDKLNQARYIKVDLKTDSNNKHVSIRRSDFLKLKGYIIVKPSVNVDIPVIDNGIF